VAEHYPDLAEALTALEQKPKHRGERGFYRVSPLLILKAREKLAQMPKNSTSAAITDQPTRLDANDDEFQPPAESARVLVPNITTTFRMNTTFRVQ
jgi:hypothetical protein